MSEPQIAQKREQNGGWVWGLLLIGLGIIFLIERFVPIGALIWPGFLAAMGVAFLAGFAVKRENWGLLIPAYICFAVAGMVWLIIIDLLTDLLIPSYIFTAIAIPFVVVWTLRPKENWWALIPAYVMASLVGLMYVISLTPPDILIPVYVLLSIAIPFLVVFALRPRQNWWALIPGGILAAVGVSLVAFSSFNIILPIALITGGVLVLWAQFGKKPAAPEAPRVDGPTEHKPE